MQQEQELVNRETENTPKISILPTTQTEKKTPEKFVYNG